MGFLHPVQQGMLNELGLDLDQRSNVKADTNNYQTSIEKVFAAGDNR
jgi:glutamate synthase (NADPH/NADH) small chain